MNGLKYIRKRCNLSLNELAEQLGLTRQAISAWENGRKPIPENRKLELAEYFGVDVKYLENLSEADTKVLTEKEMFLHKIDGKEKYFYNSENTDSKKTIFIIDEREESFDESFVKAKQRKKKLIERIDNTIDPGKASCLVAHTSIINSGCKYYEDLSTLLDQISAQERFTKVAFGAELINVLEAMLIAYAGKDYNELLSNIACYNGNINMDLTFIKELSEMFTTHWQNKKGIIQENCINANALIESMKHEKLSVLL